MHCFRWDRFRRLAWDTWRFGFNASDISGISGRHLLDQLYRPSIECFTGTDASDLYRCKQRRSDHSSPHCFSFDEPGKPSRRRTSHIDLEFSECCHLHCVRWHGQRRLERQPFDGRPNDGDGIRQRRLRLRDHMFWRPTRRQRAGARRVHECQCGRQHKEWRRWRRRCRAAEPAVPKLVGVATGLRAQIRNNGEWTSIESESCLVHAAERRGPARTPPS